MKSLMGLVMHVLQDAAVWCGVKTQRDFEEITSRVEHEGLSFLTITLSNFAKDFELGLEQGFIDSSLFLGFKRSRRSGLLPAFLQGLTSRVFYTGSGRLLDIPDTQAIFFIRQVCLMLKKVSLPCSDTRTRKAFHGYIKCERELQNWLDNVDNHLLDDFSHLSNLLWGNVLSGASESILDFLPRHGPGATAERALGNKKFSQTTYPLRLDRSFPADSFIIPNWNYIDVLEKVEFLEPGAEIPVRVITVPKTLKTPRIIAIEPVAMQYAQQGVLEWLVERLETNRITRGYINFSSQTINRSRALSSSRTKSHATIDLSEASDRVSNLLVVLLLSSRPEFSQAVQDCRSLRADVPGFGIIPLTKFASMGSALCFPIESMVFFTICILGILKEQRRPVTLSNIMYARKGVCVYGDDIIIPIEYASTVMIYLEAFGLKVNRHKSFSIGKFRESCGMDAYDGVPVTPVYVRHMPPYKQQDVQEIVSWTSLRNQLYFAGCWKSARYVQQHMDRIASFPHVATTSPVLGWYSYDNSYAYSSFNRDLCSPRVRGLCISSVTPINPLKGYSEFLLKFFIKRGNTPIKDVQHIERSGRPLRVTLKQRWATPY